jgi:hypothetical protein
LEARLRKGVFVPSSGQLRKGGVEGKTRRGWGYLMLTEGRLCKEGMAKEGGGEGRGGGGEEEVSKNKYKGN